MNPVYVWNWAFSRFLQKLALSICSFLNVNQNLKTRSSAVNSIVKLIFNVRASFKKVLQFQSSLTHFFGTKNEKSKKLCTSGKTIFRFPNKSSVSQENSTIFIMVNNLAVVSPAVHSQSGLPMVILTREFATKKYAYP